MLTNGDWENIKQIIKREIGMTHISYLTWIDPLSISHEEDQKVVLSVPHYASDNSFAIQYINTHYVNDIKAAISEYLGESVDIELTSVRTRKA